MTTTTNRRKSRFEGVPRNETLVSTTAGEYFTAGRQTNEGVEFDGGLIPWADVTAFHSFCRMAGRWVSVPL